MEHVILVDELDSPIGTMEKIEAHEKGLLHRAFSVLLFNSKGEFLLQKRAKSKYHSGGLWTNACCSHPLPEEEIEEATRRKLIQELGIEVKTHFAYKFIYKTNLDKELIEHECDHVFTGVFDGAPSINVDEVEAWKFVDLKTLQEDVKNNPDSYTYWFKLMMDHDLLKNRAT